MKVFYNNLYNERLGAKKGIIETVKEYLLGVV